MLQYGTARYGGYAAPYTPFHATELRLPIASRGFYLHPVATAALRLTLCAARLFPTEIR